MATIKSYTDLEQSKKLAKILLHESADMFYSNGNETQPTFRLHSYGHIMDDKKDIPCWSLAALVGAIPYNVSFNRAVYRFKLVKFPDYFECYHENFGSASTEIFKADNPVDACVEMIIKLNELNLL